MKSFIAFLILVLAIACNEPMQVTSHPDNRSATSGTLGSSNSENQLPNETRDTTNRLDSSIHK